MIRCEVFFEFDADGRTIIMIFDDGDRKKLKKIDNDEINTYTLINTVVLEWNTPLTALGIASKKFKIDLLKEIDAYRSCNVPWHNNCFGFEFYKKKE